MYVGRRKKSGLPDGISACKTYQLEYHSYGIGIENVGTVMNIWYILWPFWYMLWQLGTCFGHFGISYGHLV
jgi:hypothetical protein